MCVCVCVCVCVCARARARAHTHTHTDMIWSKKLLQMPLRQPCFGKSQLFEACASGSFHEYLYHVNVRSWPFRV